MRKNLKQLEEFQTKFKGVINNSPTLLSEKDYVLRHNLIVEETEEYLDACYKGDIKEVLDSLADQLYVILGTITAHGMQHIIEDVFDHIHESNMSKLDDRGLPIINGEDVFDKTRPMGKVLKSKNYFPPNLSKFLK